MPSLSSPATVARRPAALLNSVALYSGFFLTGLITALLGPLLPAIRLHYGVSVEQVGTLFVAQFVGSSVGSLFSQLHIRISIVMGLALIGIGVFALPFSQWFFVPAAVFAFGVGLGLVIPATNMLVALTRSETRAASLNILNLFWGAGAATSPIIVATLYCRIGYSDTLFTLGILSAIICLGFVTTSIQILCPASNVSATASPGRNSGMLLVFCLLFFLYIGIETIVGGWTSTYVATISGVTPWITWTVVAFWTALLGGRAVAPLVLRSVSEHWFLRVSLALAFVGMAGLIAIRTAPGALAFAILTGAGLASLFALLFSMLSRFADSKHVAIPGWLFAGAGLGGAALPWLVGVIAARTESIRFGLGVALLALVCVFSVVVVLGRLESKIEPG